MSKLDKIIGQKRAKEVIGTRLKAAVKLNKHLPHILLHGPPGMGKTSIAKAVAEDLGTSLFHTNGANVKNPSELIPILTNIRSNSVWFIDEIHSIPHRVLEYLYTILENFEIYDRNGKKIALPKFTVLAATTKLGEVQKPLRDRFKEIIELEDYSLEDLIQIVHIVSKEYYFQFPDAIATVIAKTCRSTPRLVVNRTEFLHDYMLVNNKRQITKDEILDVIKLQGIDENGLTDLDNRYLSVIGWQPTSLRNIASRLNVDEMTLLSDVEPYLIKQRLIEITPKGRKKNGNQQSQFAL